MREFSREDTKYKSKHKKHNRQNKTAGIIVIVIEREKNHQTDLGQCAIDCSGLQSRTRGKRTAADRFKEWE